MKTPDAYVIEDLASILAADLPWEKLQGRSILVTGASGFIGGHLIEALVWINRCNPAANLRIYALAREMDKLRQRLLWVDLSKEIIPVIQDVTWPWHSDVSLDYIIHAASPASPRFYMERPVETIRANTEGTTQLLELARKHRSRFLFLSSGAVYGDNSLQIDAIRETDFGSEDPLSPRACYSESKRLAETLCRSYYSQYGLDTRIARISHCYGPGIRLDDGRAIADLLADVLADRDIQLDSDGSASRPFCYVSDTVRGLFYVLLKGAAGEAYNVGETKETTIFDLAHKIIEAAGKASFLKVQAKARVGSVPAARSSGHFNIDKIAHLGWSPCVSLEVGLIRMLGCFKSDPLVSTHNRDASNQSASSSHNMVFWQSSDVDRSAREQLVRHKALTLWLTGLSASGKSTTAYELERRLTHEQRLCYVLDGDNLRHGINKGLGFTHEDRAENIRRTAEIARLMNEAGVIVIASLISPLIQDRAMAKAIIGPENFVEVYLSTPIEVCESRDPKSLYRQARLGLISNFTGVSAPYEAPATPHITVNTVHLSPQEAATHIIATIKPRIDAL